jgi:hypothetical protein
MRLLYSRGTKSRERNRRAADGRGAGEPQEKKTKRVWEARSPSLFVSVFVVPRARPRFGYVNLLLAVR